MDSTVAHLLTSGRDETRTAVRAGLMLSMMGLVVIAGSLVLSARGYYFLALAMLLAWAVGGYSTAKPGKAATGLWVGLVTGATASVITLIVAVLVHLGRLSLFGVEGNVQDLVSVGPLSGFFTGSSGGSIEDAGVGLAYIMFIVAFFSVTGAVGAVSSAVMGAVSGSVRKTEEFAEHAGEGKQRLDDEEGE